MRKLIRERSPKIKCVAWVSAHEILSTSTRSQNC
jgi:hypothetical protein